jgi:DUF971 family protein
MTLEHIAVIGDELALAFAGGKECYLPLAALRRACPCAQCQGEPDALGRVVRPGVSYGPGAFELRGWEMVGGYAIQPRWADGHNTGIYSFSYLEQLAAAMVQGGSPATRD